MNIFKFLWVQSKLSRLIQHRHCEQSEAAIRNRKITNDVMRLRVKPAMTCLYNHDMLKCIRFLCIIGIAVAVSSCGGCPRVISDANQATEILSNESDALATTRYGKVAGYHEGSLYIFKGIPYAKAERFMAPVAPDSWEGVRSSRAYGPTCPQGVRTGWASDEQAFAFNWDDGYTGEDCLRLNVWTQGLNDGKKRPVMVWFHGGGYAAGSSQELPSYDGAGLATKGDVVMVSVNHRLNVLGFLDLSALGDKYKYSANAGLLDLVASLQWVKDNIASFGGDPGNVTIFGQSGGGGKVTHIMYTPAAKGLFHKAIVQSGSIISSMDRQYAQKIGLALVEDLKIKPNELDKLNSVPYQELLAAGNRATAKVRAEVANDGSLGSLLFGFGPTVDGDVLPGQPFSSDAPVQSKDIPMLIGTTLNEFMRSGYIPNFDKLSDSEMREMIVRTYGDKTDEYIATIKKVYPNSNNRDLFDTDLMFRKMAVEQATIKAKQGGAPAYMYLFTWQSPVMDGRLRAMHCLEMPFTFNNIDRCREMVGGSAEARLLADRMSSAWLNFAKTGNPNTSNLPQWEPFEPDKGATMVFDSQCEIVYNHDSELLRKF